MEMKSFAKAANLHVFVFRCKIDIFLCPRFVKVDNPLKSLIHLFFKMEFLATSAGSKVDKLILKAPSKVCSRRHSKIFIFYFSE